PPSDHPADVVESAGECRERGERVSLPDQPVRSVAHHGQHVLVLVLHERRRDGVTRGKQRDDQRCEPLLPHRLNVLLPLTTGRTHATMDPCPTSRSSVAASSGLPSPANSPPAAPTSRSSRRSPGWACTPAAATPASCTPVSTTRPTRSRPDSPPAA